MTALLNTTVEQVLAEAPKHHGVALAKLQGMTWEVRGEPLSGSDVINYYCLIRARQTWGTASCRRWDRAIAILKREGLVVFVRGGVGWRCTDEVTSTKQGGDQ